MPQSKVEYKVITAHEFDLDETMNGLSHEGWRYRDTLRTWHNAQLNITYIQVLMERVNG